MINPGVIIFFDEAQRRDLIVEETILGQRGFSDALSIPDWDLRKLHVALLAFSDSTLDYIALAKRGKRVATAKSRVAFSDLLSLGAIPLKKLSTTIDANLKSFLIRSSRGIGGRIPEESWVRLIAVIKQMRPNIAKEIDRLLSLSEFSGYRLTGELSDLLVQEREALGAALDIFSGDNQLREAVLSSWAPPPGSVQEVNEETMEGRLAITGESEGFLNSIPRRVIQEESAIQHDLINWEGITPKHEAGVSTFKQGERILEIHYANRNAL